MSKVMTSPRRRLFVAGKIPAKQAPRTLTLLVGDTVKTITLPQVPPATPQEAA